jgi:hypothetical protein
VAPQTQYAKSGDINIAYQVVGEGPFDLVYVPGWISNVELFWERPKPAPHWPAWFHAARRLGGRQPTAGGCNIGDVVAD